jgi:hypothetical protein
MLTTKFHTLLIPLSEEYHEELFALYKNISKKFTNQYLDEKSYKAHITIGVLPLRDKDTQKFVDACTKAVLGTKKFKVTFDHFELSEEKKYIFLNLDRSSEEKILDLRKKFEKETEEKFKIEIPQKYLEIWDSFTNAEKERLKDCGSPHQFEPHISIVKLNPEDSGKALEEAKGCDILGKSFEIKKFQISGQSEDPDNQYPVLKEIVVG